MASRYERLSPKDESDRKEGTEGRDAEQPAAADGGPPPPLVLPAADVADAAEEMAEAAGRADHARVRQPQPDDVVPARAASPPRLRPRPGYDHRTGSGGCEWLRFLTQLWDPLSLVCGLQWRAAKDQEPRRLLAARAWSLSALTASVVYGTVWEISRWVQGLPDMEQSSEPFSRLCEMLFFALTLVSWYSGTGLFAARAEVVRGVLRQLPLHSRNVTYSVLALIGGFTNVVLAVVAYTATLAAVAVQPSEIVMWLALTWANLIVTVQCALYILCAAHIIDLAEQYASNPPEDVEEADREYMYLQEKAASLNRHFGPFLLYMNVCAIARYTFALVWRKNQGSLPWAPLVLSLRWALVAIVLNVVAVKVYRSQQGVVCAITMFPFGWTPQHMGLFHKASTLQFRAFFDPSRVFIIAIPPNRFYLLLSYYVAVTTYLVPEVTKIWQ
eukprot:TRINITY_DN19768_c0_g1_i1.p1 TRINITY_DN19768_c0_g1~~TRINITY_DN19768_c0_g1_i1.p1  ORF type:complete len:443 (+),score=121.78 TRINITY_DN19768_c0_g1_i1:59-1387(+)